MIDGPRRELGFFEKKNWRKNPTMRVSDMANNPNKATVEN
jgi:hypothetical protein